MKLNREDTVDITLFFAMFRCFHEQLYALKGIHSGLIKKKFNRLISTARQYEKELLINLDDSPELEHVYDCLMDVMNEVRNEIDKGYEQQK